MKKSFKVMDKSGVHARPAAQIVREASKYDDNIDIVYKGNTYTLKSIMIVMSLGIKFEETFDIIVTGENEETILENLETILHEHAII